MLYLYLLFAVITPSLLFGADDDFSILPAIKLHDEVIIKHAIARMPQLFSAYATFTPKIIEQKKRKIRVVVEEKGHMAWSVPTEKKDIVWEVGYHNGIFRAWATYFVVAGNKWSGDKKGGYIETVEIVNNAHVDTYGVELLRKKFITHICEELKKQGCAQVNSSLSRKDYATEERKTYAECGFIVQDAEKESILVEKYLN